MFEARNTAAALVLRSVQADGRRSRLLGRVLGTVFDNEQVKTNEDHTLEIALIGTAGIIAAITAGYQSLFPQAPDGKTDTSVVEKGKEWIKDIFKSKAEKEVDEMNTGTQVGPSPLSNPNEVSANRVKTAKPSDMIAGVIKNTAASNKIDYALLYAVAGAESSFRKEADVSTSSAIGLFQFTESTWTWLVKKYDLGFTLEDRKNPQKSAVAATLYLKEITSTLQRALGRKPSYGEVYMGYFMGPGGATQFLKELKKNPNAIAAELFPKAAKSNPWVFYSKDKKPLTLAQVMAKQDGKIASYAQDADPSYNRSIATVESPPAPTTPQSAQASSATSVPSSLVTPASTNPGPKSVIPIQSVPSVSSGTETAPPIKEKAAPSGSSQNKPMIMPAEGQPVVNTTIVRGRDNRLYSINH